MVGVYQHCAEHQFAEVMLLNEFDFRYSNRIALGVDDIERTRLAVKGTEASASPINNLVLRNRLARFDRNRA